MPSLLAPSLVALVPVAIGVVLIVRSRRGGPARPACGECGCDISELDGKVTACPTCGSSFAEAGIVSDRGGPRPGLMAAGVMLIMLGAGCLGGAVIAQRASERAARKADAAAEDARQRANEAIEKRIADGRAEALEHADAPPKTQPAPESAAETPPESADEERE